VDSEAAKLAEPPKRPDVWVKAADFNDGTRLTFGHSDIVVVVGPNNAGKSALLKELYGRLAQGQIQSIRIATSVQFEFTHKPEEVEKWLTTGASQGQNGFYHIPGVGLCRPGELISTWHNKQGTGLQRFANLMAVHLGTEARLTAADPVELIDFTVQVPTHPLHRLYDDDELEARLDKIFYRAFRQNLVVNRGAGRNVTLHVGVRSHPPCGKDRLSNEFRLAVKQLPLADEQGDGIRAFVGVLANVLAVERAVTFIDEPEAFLHPPQAYMIGRVLAEEIPNERQIFVATHSTDFLRGVLDHSSTRVRVIRLQRTGDVNHVTELKPEDVRHVWADPLLRYSKVLDGLFHDGVIICEGDADCRFYGAMLDAVRGSEAGPDLAFVYGAGKSRIATIVRSLKAIGVPVRVVVDFDVLRDEGDLKVLISSLGGDWATFETDWRTVKTAIDHLRAQIPTSDARREILAIFDKERSQSLTEPTIKNIREVLRKGSAWDNAKRSGKAFIPSGQPSAAYEKLCSEFRKIGLFLVEVGELEGFCRTIGGHGPAWVTEVLERELAQDKELEGARDFARLLGSSWP
jgi:energy-coupling factor transporter ATP-binding protein EcfA2